MKQIARAMATRRCWDEALAEHWDAGFRAGMAVSVGVLVGGAVLSYAAVHAIVWLLVRAIG